MIDRVSGDTRGSVLRTPAPGRYMGRRKNPPTSSDPIFPEGKKGRRGAVWAFGMRSPSAICRRLVVPVALVLAACSGSTASDLFGPAPTGPAPTGTSSSSPSASAPSAPTSEPAPTEEPAAPPPPEPAPTEEPPPERPSPGDASLVDAGRPDARDASTTCAPQPSVCPTGWTYSNDGRTHTCSVAFSAPAGARPYCEYSSMGYLGYSFPLTPAYTCPTGARYAPSTVGYCLWEGIVLPPGTSITCTSVASGSMRFSWPCGAP